MDRPNFLFFKEDDWSSKHPLAEPYPKIWYQDRLWPMMKVMDRIRLASGVALYVTPNGGYRCLAHNRAVAGKSLSEHLEGRATDFTARGVISNDQLYQIVLNLLLGGAIDAVSGLGVYESFIHIDVGGKRRPDGSPRRWDERSNERRRQIP